MPARDLRSQGVNAGHRECWRWAVHGRHLRLFVPTITGAGRLPEGHDLPLQAVRFLSLLAGWLRLAGGEVGESIDAFRHDNHRHYHGS